MHGEEPRELLVGQVVLRCTATTGTDCSVAGFQSLTTQEATVQYVRRGETLACEKSYDLKDYYYI